MASPKVNLLPPIGNGMNGYDRTKRHSDQPVAVPSVFIDAMMVREAVFVDEQNCPLEVEYDDADPRAFQWTIHAAPPLPRDSAAEEALGQGSARQLAGTLRLVPPPHQMHPPKPDHPVSKVAAEGRTSISLPLHPAPPSNNPDNEPYFMLGRLAFMRAFRGTGLAKLLVDLSLGYIAQNPTTVTAKKFTSGGDEEQGEWKGLVLVHAQRPLEGLYCKWGFKTDQGMGVWLEEDIEHVGMWRRLTLETGNLTDPQAKD